MLNIALSDRYLYQPATWDDVDRIVALRNASAHDTRGTDVTAHHWQRRHYYESGIHLDTDTMLVFDGEKAIAYVEVTGEAPSVIYEMIGVVEPSYRGQGIGSTLIRWAEARVRRCLVKAPEGTAVFLHSPIFESNQGSRDLLTSHDFMVVREFVHLEITMDRKPPEPMVSDGIEIRSLRPSDWNKVGPALDEAFQDHWGYVDFKHDESDEDHPNDEDAVDPRQADPEAFNRDYFNSTGLCFVAWDGDEVAGSCLCNATTVEFPGSGYLGSLSIRRPWRRHGLGLALTNRALNAFFARGTYHVLTDTDGDSFTGAYRVYQNAGMTIFRRELIFEKMIRPGCDLVQRGMTSDAS